MFLRACLSALLLTSTVFAANLKDYSDYKTLPEWSSLAFEALLKAQVISGTDAGKLNPTKPLIALSF